MSPRVRLGIVKAVCVAYFSNKRLLLRKLQNWQQKSKVNDDKAGRPLPLLARPPLCQSLNFEAYYRYLL